MTLEERVDGILLYGLQSFQLHRLGDSHKAGLKESIVGVLRAARVEALEEAAKVADEVAHEHEIETRDHGTQEAIGIAEVARAIAAAIRALAAGERGEGATVQSPPSAD